MEKLQSNWDSRVFVIPKTAGTAVQPSLNPSLGVPYFQTEHQEASPTWKTNREQGRDKLTRRERQKENMEKINIQTDKVEQTNRQRWTYECGTSYLK